MMNITATQVTYYHICHRKLWLSAKGIQMENASNNAFVEEGKLLSESTYDRRPIKWKELSLEGIKIDHYDSKNKIVREVKKSAKLEQAHIAQVKYYIYALEQRGVEKVSGIIEYPKQKRKTEVTFNTEDRKQIKIWESEIVKIIEQPECPDLILKSYCKNCAFYDFCFV